MPDPTTEQKHKPISKEYLLTQLQNFDGSILENKYAFKFATMPTAAADFEGVIAQYIGATNANYVRAFFYECVKNPDGTYAWTAAASQDGVTLAKKDTAEDGFAATYYIKNIRTNAQIGESINIPKDWLLKDAKLKTCTVADNPENGYVVGDKYFEFEFNTMADGDSKSVASTFVYLKVTDLFNDYSSGKGISVLDLQNHVISVDIVEGDGLKFTDDTNNAKLTLDYETTNINFSTEWSVASGISSF